MGIYEYWVCRTDRRCRRESLANVQVECSSVGVILVGPRVMRAGCRMICRPSMVRSPGEVGCSLEGSVWRKGTPRGVRKKPLDYPGVQLR